MDKHQAQAIIKETCEESFGKDRFSHFIKNLLNFIDESKAFHARGDVKEMFRHIIKTYERLGTYTDPRGKKIDIIITYLQKGYSLDHARVTQRNFAGRYLADRGEKNAGLFAFVSPDENDWRFSLVKMDYRFEQAKNGKVKVKEEFTPARRWSFLVGKNEASHTAKRQFVPILLDDEHNPTLAQLEEKFNIETVTKEFFEKYRELFLWTKETLDGIVENNSKIKSDFEAKGVNTVDFAKKLLGQIVFLYFFQKKGWFGVPRDAECGMGSKKFLRDLFKGKHGNYTNFFNDILEPLFYEALRIDRRHDDDYYSRFNCKIPFLNGGLFDPIGGYDWVHTDILLPNKLFSNQNKTEEGDTGNGILDIFDRYNFTVKEDEPLEKEVAIDPEMLGKVFENLLEVKDRKSKGTYYTPREIVHYMCQQSLINYLNTELNKSASSYEKLGERQLYMLGNEAKIGQLDFTIEHKSKQFISKEDIETLIKFGELFAENEATALEKERNIADGKQQTTSIKAKLPANIRKNAKLIDDKLANIKVCDPAIGSGAFPVGMMHEIVKIRNFLNNSYIKDKSKTIYHFKRECIENSLYGVDIDPGAVEIAKLRLWLSLVVDEEDIKQIKPLPNLDYKIVCGNSLLGVEKDLFNSQLFDELERLKPLLFNETNPTRKQEYKRQIDELISEITNGHKEFDFEVYFSEVFHEKKGFDVVIANPPYETSRSKGIDEDSKMYFKRNYETAEDKYDYYVFFIEKSSKIVRKNGTICLITPSTFLLKPLSKKVRKYLLSKYEILTIDEFKGLVFESVVPTAIIIFKNKTADEAHRIKGAYNIDNIESFINGSFSELSIKQSVFCKEPNYYINIYADEWFFSFFEKLSGQEKMVKLGKLAEIYNGIQTGNDKKYVSYEKKSNKWDKVLVGRDIQRYYKKWGGKYVCYEPSRLHSNTRKDIFKTKEKIIIRQTSDRITGAYDDEEYFTLASTFVIKQFQQSLSYKALLGVLNSTLFLYLYRNLNNEEGRVLPQIKKKHIFDLPIKVEFVQEPLINSVDKILTIGASDDYQNNKSKQAKVKSLEAEIDQLVYKLYGLTPEEIAIIEGEKK